MRRGFVTVGTWCLDRNITVDAWPSEDMLARVLEVDRAGGGSACNFAVDMRRLDPSMPVETQGLIGAGEAGDFLVEVADSHGIGRAGLHRTAAAQTQVTDAYLSRATGRRTHIAFFGVAPLLSPDHVDFTGTTARYMHLGLPGIHDTMDRPWQGEASGWLAVLKRARAAGLETNFEFVAGAPEAIRAIAYPCLPHLDTLVVNDYEIGAMAGRDTIAGDRTDVAAVRVAAADMLARGAMDCVVVHYTRGATLVARDGTVIEQPSVAIPDSARKGANGAGDAFAAGFFYGRHEGWALRDCLRMGHAAAAACLRSAGTYTSVEDARTCLALADGWGWRS
ncbi:MAG: carbohydrate kinase family protein [Roseivivax sp.]|nr:carbohydrate kinase family protein [Roseivivax sp.]